MLPLHYYCVCPAQGTCTPAPLGEQLTGSSAYKKKRRGNLEDIPTPLWKHIFFLSRPLKGAFLYFIRFFSPANEVINAYLEIICQSDQGLIGRLRFSSLVSSHSIRWESAQFRYYPAASALLFSQPLQSLRESFRSVHFCPTSPLCQINRLFSHSLTIALSSRR